MTERLPPAAILLAVAVVACATSSDATRDVTAEVANEVLQSTTWHLVRFEGGDGTVLTPDHGSKYTLDFEPGGRLAVRVDCNRGSGTWTSEDPSQIRFGPVGLTRMMCPPGSLHDRVARDFEYVRTYLIQDGHLFLSLMADAGIYEYEPSSPEGDSSGT